MSGFSLLGLLDLLLFCLVAHLLAADLYVFAVRLGESGFENQMAGKRRPRCMAKLWLFSRDRA
jgi:hypothetical protein